MVVGPQAMRVNTTNYIVLLSYLGFLTSGCTTERGPDTTRQHLEMPRVKVIRSGQAYDFETTLVGKYGPYRQLNRKVALKGVSYGELHLWVASEDKLSITPEPIDDCVGLRVETSLPFRLDVSDFPNTDLSSFKSVNQEVGTVVVHEGLHMIRLAKGIRE